jgi:hypothetical protein
MLDDTDFNGSDLRGVNFEYSQMIGSNLRGANLTDTEFYQANMTDADLTFADARGSSNLNFNPAASFRSIIRTDGKMYSFQLLDGETMRFWDYDAQTPVLIHAMQSFSAAYGSSMRFVFEDSEWGSTIEFDDSISFVYIAGTLELAMKLDDGLTPGDLLGATFQLFDWTGVAIDGGFDDVVLDPAWFAAGLSIDLSQLMTTGEVRIVPLIGDLDGDGFVGIADLNIVLDHWNQTVTAGSLRSGDLDGDGFIGIEDLNAVLGTWNSSVPPPASDAAVPEPTTALGLGTFLLARSARRPNGRV